MNWGRIACVAIGGIAVVGVAFIIQKISLPTLPPPEKVERVVGLPQGLTADELERLHYSAQGTVLLPTAWLNAMEQGFFSAKSVKDHDTLAQLRYLTDDVHKSADWNPAGLPIGWGTASWVPPGQKDGSISNVGFSCATCHTGQLNYKGTGIRIEGAGGRQDTGTYQEIIAKSILATWLLPWKRNAFIEAVSRETGAKPEDVSAQLHGAFIAVKAATLQQIRRPLYVPEGYGRTDALQRIANTLLGDDLKEAGNNQVGDAPVKFPYLWSIWRLNWVQYNASVRQPMVRNVGQAIGVRAETNFVDSSGGPTEGDARWNTSIHIDNLQWIEEVLRRLEPPKWPEAILGKLDPAQAVQGRKLFDEICAHCHAIYVLAEHAPPEWRVTEVPLEEIGTDPGEAKNFIDHKYSAKKLGIDEPVDGADGLRIVTNAVKTRAYDRAGYSDAQREIADGFGRQNSVRALAIYKARPLVGVWATPPYLHNGSVPTLFDMLSPTRPEKFTTGVREYDPIKVGYCTTNLADGEFPRCAVSFAGMPEFNVNDPGNSNQGHWFTDDQKRRGRIGRALSEDERWAIIAYLKSATYADYPCLSANADDTAAPPADACEGTLQHTAYTP